jgi:hypothetical protein
MPTVRRLRVHAERFGDAGLIRLHLATDDCLLAGPGGGCACGLRGPDGRLREADARRLWAQHRAQILAEWGTKPGRPWAAELFDAN